MEILHFEEVLSLKRIETVGRIVDVLAKSQHNGFPVVLEEEFTLCKKQQPSQENNNGSLTHTGGKDSNCNSNSNLAMAAAPATDKPSGSAPPAAAALPLPRVRAGSSSQGEHRRLLNFDEEQLRYRSPLPQKRKTSLLLGHNHHQRTHTRSQSAFSFSSARKEAYMEWDGHTEGPHLVGFIYRKTLVQLLALRRFQDTPELTIRQFDNIARWDEMEGNYPRYPLIDAVVENLQQVSKSPSLSNSVDTLCLCMYMLSLSYVYNDLHIDVM